MLHSSYLTLFPFKRNSRSSTIRKLILRCLSSKHYMVVACRTIKLTSSRLTSRRCNIWRRWPSRCLREINTVDQYQGRDKEAIVYNCTKSEPKLISWTRMGPELLCVWTLGVWQWLWHEPSTNFLSLEIVKLFKDIHLSPSYYLRSSRLSAINSAQERISFKYLNMVSFNRLQLQEHTCHFFCKICCVFLEIPLFKCIYQISTSIFFFLL
jgi:hypothetical protein